VWKSPWGILLTLSIDLSTARLKWRLDGPALSGHLLYSLVNHAYANRYHHHLVRKLVSNIIMQRYGFHIIISIEASDAEIMKTRTGGRAVDRSIDNPVCKYERLFLVPFINLFKEYPTSIVWVINNCSMW